MAGAGSTQSDLNALPTEALRVKAAEQRTRLHRTANDLREKINQTKERFTPANQVREHLMASSLLAAGVAAIFGFGVAGFFTRH